MTLGEYFKQLKDFIDKNPTALEYEVVYSKDDEGNEYNPVIHGPTLGFHDVDDRSFIDVTLFDEYDIEPTVDMSVCIN